jgi:DNA-binding MarR family transcriptional regulator
MAATEADNMENQSGKQTSITKEEYEVLAAFRRELRLFLHFSENAAKNVGLTPQQYQALLAIKGFPGREQVTVGELAEQLQIRHHSAVGLVDRLVLQQLVLREAAMEDRRRVYVKLAPHGMEILEQLATIHKQELKHIGVTVSSLLKSIIGGETTP